MTPTSTEANASVSLGDWSVAELRAVGFDACGLVQPLLRSADLPPAAESEPVLQDLADRGLLARTEGDGVRPDGLLGELVLYRALARRTTVVRPGWFELTPPDRVLILSDVAGVDSVLLVEETDGRVSAVLADARDVALDLVTAALATTDLTIEDRVDDVMRPVNGFEVELVATARPLLQLEGISTQADDLVIQATLTMVQLDDSIALLIGAHTGDQVGLLLASAGRLDLVDQITVMLSTVPAEIVAG